MTRCEWSPEQVSPVEPDAERMRAELIERAGRMGSTEFSVKAERLRQAGGFWPRSLADWETDAGRALGRAIQEARQMSFHVATMDAERCEWVAAGETREDALAALLAGYNAAPYYGEQATLPAIEDPERLVEQFGARVVLMSEGWCARDGEQCAGLGEVNRPAENDDEEVGR